MGRIGRLRGGNINGCQCIKDTFTPGWSQRHVGQPARQVRGSPLVSHALPIGSLLRYADGQPDGTEWQAIKENANVGGPQCAARSFPGSRTREGRLPFGLPLELTVDDPDTVRELVTFREGEPRERYALNALRIGVLALRQARGQIDADLVRQESERLLSELNSRLGSHAQTVHDCVADSLKHYFDPKDGRLQERIDRLIGRDGELESMLRRQIGDQDSQLTKTLSAHVGTESPLMRVLSPDQSRGVLAAIRDAVEQQLKAQREQVLNQFSLDNKEGALSRFITELSQQQTSLSGELHVKIDRVVREFTLDQEDSALSKLVHRVDDAHQKIAQPVLARQRRVGTGPHEERAAVADQRTPPGQPTFSV